MTAAVHYLMFDTLRFVETLTASGMPELQAKALMEVHKEMFEDTFELNFGNLATKDELKDIKMELKADIDKIKVELFYIRWMLGILIVMVGSLLVKAFV